MEFTPQMPICISIYRLTNGINHIKRRKEKSHQTSISTKKTLDKIQQFFQYKNLDKLKTGYYFNTLHI